MTATVIDGTAAAEELRATVDDELHVLRLSEVRPGLGTVLAEMGKSPLIVENGLLREECADLFLQWLKSGKARAY